MTFRREIIEGSQWMAGDLQEFALTQLEANAVGVGLGEGQCRRQLGRLAIMW